MKNSFPVFFYFIIASTAGISFIAIISLLDDTLSIKLASKNQIEADHLKSILSLQRKTNVHVAWGISRKI